MRWKVILLIEIAALSISGIILANNSREINPQVTVPAQWEQQESIWLAWPELEPVKGRSNIPQVVDIMATITPYEYVDLIVNDQKEETFARQFILKRGISLDQVRFHPITHTDFWMRDYSICIS